MRLRDFVQHNKDAIDEHIRYVLKNPKMKLTNKDREEWIMNDELLYRWAQSYVKGL